MTAPTLTTDRLVLRQLVARDASALHATLSDPQVMHWWSSGAHGDLAETEAYIGFNTARDAGHLCWAITLGDDVALGWVILRERRAGVAELGYILRRDKWGQGIAREALARVIEHGFSEIGYRRIYADTDPDNAGSIALLERLGFSREAHLREEWETHIGVRDSFIYGLLRGEWTAHAAERAMEHG
ncbi:GNAT family N-acetyltransferase [Sphingopyxis sp. XHP0097]|uniref:GNAT family N-acetyltransferase n=1 Tax=Sphingopyxis jiangsuensis TaxID=2871171 RepID=A0ABS7MD51_9SPHN|nr:MULTISPECIES: GNAT family N-acetyltransferase [Sphingopyxis]MBY4636935.1 GNAT family N-acetyltransferase [Sphingopyxis jiangsuensis]